MASRIFAYAEDEKNHVPSMYNGDASEEEVTGLLKEFRLTRLESEIFIGLLRTGKSTAKDLSQQLGINRVEVYRILRRLVTRGLVVVTPSDPALFDSVQPRVALLALIGEIERKARQMKEIAPTVALQLE